MRLDNSTVGVLVLVVVLGAVGPTLAGVQPEAGSVESQSPPSSAACDYAQLYNETIGSVVLVRQPRGQGSGFVFRVADNGTSYITTNQHVIAGADRVQVKFREGDTRTGTVVGTSEAADLGVVRVTDTPGYASALPVAENAPTPGQQVAALGAPFGLRGTITHGIVSGTDRAVPSDRGFVIPNVIQTDVPINPGNSGGPLVTCTGTVVGVNTAGIPAGQAENIGFAVSASLINRVVPSLINSGEFRFAFLGVRTVEVTPAVAQANDLRTTRGIMVIETVEDSPAAERLQGADRTVTVDGQQVPAGGDVIVAIEGQPIRSREALSSYLATETSPGDRVTLTVIRDGERRTVAVTLGERPAANS